MKQINNNTDDDTYDDKIRGKIIDIRMILSRLGNIVTNKDKEKEKIYGQLVELLKIYHHNDCDDPEYYRIRDIENLLMLMLMIIIITNQY